MDDCDRALLIVA